MTTKGKEFRSCRSSGVTEYRVTLVRMKAWIESTANSAEFSRNGRPFKKWHRPDPSIPSETLITEPLTPELQFFLRGIPCVIVAL
jgi:hypothetical protein